MMNVLKASYLRLLFIFILFATISAKCSSCKNSKQEEPHDIQISVTLSKDIFYIEDGNTKITLHIKSNQQLASALSYECVAWSVQDDLGKLVNESGDPVSPGSILKYGDNELYYQPIAGSEGKHLLELIVSDEEEKIEKKKQIEITVRDHRPVDFQVRIQSDKPTLFAHQQAKLIVDISSLEEKARELTYTIKSISSNKEGASFSTPETTHITAGHSLKYGINTIYYNVDKQIGSHTIKLVIANEKGDIRNATVTLPIIDVDFQIAMTSEEPTVFVHQQAKLIINITSPQEEASELTYRIKSISSNKERTSFSTTETTHIAADYPVKYGINTLYYNPDGQTGKHDIRLVVANSNGTSKIVTTSFEVINTDFQVQLKLEKPSVFLHQQEAKFIVDISSPQKEASKLTYQIKEISSNREGTFFSTIGGDDVSGSYALKYGKNTNTLCYNPVKQVGIHDIKLIVINSNDHAKLVTASINVIDADFFSQAKLQEVTRKSEKSLELSIRVGSNEIAKEDTWQLASWKIEGGTVGKLQDAAGQELKVKNVTLQSSENRFKLILANKIELTNLSQLTVVIKQPDGLEKPFVIDLSNYILADLVNHIKTVEAEMISSSKKFIMGEKFAEDKFNRATSQLQIIKNNLGILGESDSINKNQLEDAMVKVDEIFSYSETVAIDKVIYNKFGRGINEKDSYGRTPLIEAIDKNDEKGIDLVLTHPNIDLQATHIIANKNNNATYPALSYAIIRRVNDITIPTKLLKAGTNIESRVLINKKALLMPPIDKEQTFVSPEERSKYKTYTVIGAKSKDIIVVDYAHHLRYVEERNKKVQAHNELIAKTNIVKSEWSPHHMLPNQDYKGDTPLHVAAEDKLLEPIKLLLSQGADINVKNGYWQTPLHLAINSAKTCVNANVIEVIKYLIAQGADINAVDLNDNTPLHYAMYTSNVELINLLLDSGAIYKLKNRLYGKNKLGNQINQEGWDPCDLFSKLANRSEEIENYSIIVDMLYKRTILEDSEAELRLKEAFEKATFEKKGT